MIQEVISGLTPQEVLHWAFLGLCGLLAATLPLLTLYVIVTRSGREALRMGVTNLGRNPLRTGLTGFGIIIGVGAVVGPLIIGVGLEAGVHWRGNVGGTALLASTKCMPYPVP